MSRPADEEHQPGRLARIKSGAAARWAALRARHAWLRHVLAAYAQMSRTNANQYAAAITFFSFLALFPMILLGVSIVSYVLFSQPHLQQELFNKVSQQAPGPFGDTLKQSLHTAIADRAGVGLVGLAGVLLTGLGWIGNLRQSIDAVWGKQVPKMSFIGSRVANLAVLVGLGISVVVSLGLTTIGTSLTTQLLDLVGLGSLPGATYVLKVIGIAIAVLGDMLIFWWVLIRLPKADIERTTALQGVLLAAIGFEILKIVGTYTIAHAAMSKTAGPFATPIAILVWIQLVVRYMLFCTAWLATAQADRRTANSIPVVPQTGTGEPAAGVRASTVGVTLVGAGAVAGAAATFFGGRAARRRRTSARGGRS